MGLLARLGAISLVSVVGCYAPDVRNCTVSCGAVSDCASGQTCGTDHFCAAPSIAGHCAERPVDDAGNPIIDAAVLVDATRHDAMMPHDAVVVPPDAPPPVQLHIVITGHGHVDFGMQSCDWNGPQHGDCQFAMPFATPVTLTATAQSNWQFHAWTTPPCASQGMTCTFTPFANTLAAIEFQTDQQGGGD